MLFIARPCTNMTLQDSIAAKEEFKNQKFYLFSSLIRGYCAGQ